MPIYFLLSIRGAPFRRCEPTLLKPTLKGAPSYNALTAFVKDLHRLPSGERHRPKAHQFQVATPGSTKPALWRDGRPPPGPSLGIWPAADTGWYIPKRQLGFASRSRWDTRV